ncbi:hypothetical protein [Dongia sp.]|uniref:hypothetical protein n=1 Tax=Dongia sp. TaxID=1977262 RepID=UPI0035B09135
MPESKKIDEYRRALHDLAKSPGSRKPQDRQSAPERDLEGKAAKLGLEIQGEESKGAPKPVRNKPVAPKH